MRAGRNLPLILVLALAACSPAPPKRIFLFVVDTLRHDHVGVSAENVETPNIDRLALGAQVFENATSSFHQTSMSMGALLTGRTPSIERGNGSVLPWTSATWCGLSRFATADDQACVPASVQTLAERLRDGGYWTAGVVANQLLFDPSGFSQGFDAWVEQNLGAGGLAASLEETVAKLIEGRERDPLFLYVHWIDVHQYGERGGYRPSNYRPAVETFDTEFGRVIDRIEAAGLFENALVVFTSDHGEVLGERTAVRQTRSHNGNPSFDPVLRVPLIARPGLDAAAGAPLRSQDVPGLILRAAGIEPETSGSILEPDELFLGERQYQTYRRGRFKSTRKRSGGPSYLFDLANDPGETRDVAAEHPEVMTSHDQRVSELANALASERRADSVMSEADRETLRALGYLE